MMWPDFVQQVTRVSCHWCSKPARTSPNSARTKWKKW